jgi:hypothetical protein
MARLFRVKYELTDDHGKVVETFQAQKNLELYAGDETVGKLEAFEEAAKAAKLELDWPGKDGPVID